ncbi:hypothetical protein AMB3_2536 [plant metagenome]
MPKTTHSQDPLKSPGDPRPEPAPAPGDPTGPDAPPPRPEAIKKPATGGSSGSGNAIQAAGASALQGKILPPSSPVDVPRLPPKPTADTPDEARNYGQPRVDGRNNDNWADSVKPKPDAKHARTHLP